ncbi:MAG: ATP-binding cassette domain-containing protein [Candidatus Limnocylindrales bacterium]
MNRNPTQPAGAGPGRLAIEAIEVVDLVKTYGGGIRALDGISLTVQPATIFGLLGPNGAGKSTTVRILSTLSRADSGSARILGVDVAREADRIRRMIGLVGQHGAVDSEATGRENLLLQGHLHGMAGALLRRRVEELLERFGLVEAAGRVVKTWSGGMQRKLDVASGLVHEPHVLFLDEPTTGLDPEARADLWTEVERLAAGGLTILLTTHYLEEADRLAGQVAILDHGRIVARGTPDQLKSELRGDAIVVELRESAANGQASMILAGVDGVREPALTGRTLRARADDGARSVPSVLAALDAAGLGVISVTVARPSLDDVYLQHTGRAYRPETQEAVR